MSEEVEELKQLAEIQANLYTVEQLLNSQQAKHDQLTEETLSYSNDLISELRLLSLIRYRFLCDKTGYEKGILRSQELHEKLSFSALEYCPSFFDSNVLNHYITFISFLRSHLDILAECLYSYSQKYPQKITRISSLFLSIFQQGWCKEEDHLLFLTLRQLAILQFERKSQIQFNVKENVLNPPRFSPSKILSMLEPLSSFVTSYLFNGASFSYLQCALSHVVTILHSLSRLRNLRNQFSTNSESNTYAAMEYWTVICDNALLCFDSLIRCMDLLPPGVPQLFRFIRQFENGNEKCMLLFFESFVCRALDNPQLLGLLPWHPGNVEWSPTRDITAVFRSKYGKYSISSYRNCLDIFQNPLTHVLSLIPAYEKINFDIFLDALTNTKKRHDQLISECELLYTNPNFPKELVITARDLCVLHLAALSIPKNKVNNKNFEKILDLLNNIPEKNEYINEHFKIVLLRQKEVTIAAKSVRTKSLFSFDEEVSTTNLLNFPFENYFCDIIANFPSFAVSISSFKPKNAKEFFEKMRIVAPYFVSEKLLTQSDALFYYAINNTKSISSLFPKIYEIINQRNSYAMNSADKTSALRIHYQRITSSLSAVKKMRENVQGYMLSNVARYLIRNDLNYCFKIVMSKSINFLSNTEILKQSFLDLKEIASNVLEPYKLLPQQCSLIYRILFFLMTDHVSFRRFVLSDQSVWKKSVIISTIIENNHDEIINEILSNCKEQFVLREKYLQRASDLLGHIQPNSGIAVILYYVVKMSKPLYTFVAVKFEQS
ncbi:hypothetical protein GPJ56_004391 [Histomonas meleagridis]|uniref:uncharacterized protein n=1 Tax=Histomonas meleagridis TaxID=135588 RepID=UPI00355ABA0B|nr:hypothetical protein GPJ56_004391 [Histomonas meleagridis]KAH0799965.1 hypothetical protein GO595_007077 [Histomonas meleagridis]